MAIELRPGCLGEERHVCAVPTPSDPDTRAGYTCDCGRRWVFQPAHWDPQVTVEELRIWHEADELLRHIMAGFQRREGVILRLRRRSLRSSARKGRTRGSAR